MSGPGLSARGKNNLNKSVAAANFYNPTTVAGLAYRFRASSLLGYANGSAVSSFSADVGGLALTQTTSASQPTYVASGLSGKPAIRFDGIDDFLTSTAVSVAAPQTIVFVMNVRNSTDNQQIIYTGGGPEILVDSSQWAVFRSALVKAGAPTLGGHTLISSFTSSTGNLYVDGVPVITSSQTAGNVAMIHVGATPAGAKAASMDLYEILVYSSALSVTERALIDSYVQATYGVISADSRPPVIDAVSTIPGLSARYRADQIIGQASGTGVATWPDLGPGLYDATQTTSGSQPKYMMNVLGAQPSVRFDGASSFMISNAPASDPQQTTIAVMNFTGVTARTIRGSSDTGGLQFRISDYKPQYVKQAIADIGLASGAGSSLTQSAYYAVSATYDSTSGYFSFFANGMPIGSGTNVQPLTPGRTTVIGKNQSANGEWFTGDILELITYNRALSQPELAQIHAYTQARYGLMINDTPSGVSGLSSWYKTDAITGATDGSNVAAWPDSSGNNYTAVQDYTVANAPIYKVGVANTKPVLRFGASGTVSIVRSTSPSWSPAQTFFIVYSAVAVQSGSVNLRNVDIGGLGIYLQNGYPKISKAGISVIMNGTTITPIGSFTILAVTYQDAATIATYINGTKTDGTSHSTTLSTQTDPFYANYGASGLFGGGQFIGDIAEIISYSRQLSLAEISNVDTYLQQKYALTITDRTLPFTETFNGTDGAAWSKGWTVTTSGASASGTIQSNAGRQATTGTGFQWVNAQLTQVSALINTGITGSVYPQVNSTSGSSSYIYLSSDTQDYSIPQNGVYFVIAYDASGNVIYYNIQKKIGNSGTDVPRTFAYKTITGGPFRYRFEKYGPFVRARVWAASAAEPASWDATAFDPLLTTMSGRAGASFANNDAAYLDNDDITVYSPSVINLGYKAADSFNRANQTGLGTLLETGQTWVSDSGWNIVSNAAKWTGTSDGNALVNSGLTDNFAIRFTTTSIVTGSYSYGVQLRYISPSSYIKIFVNGSNWNISLSGSLTNIGSASIANGDQVDVLYSGLTVKVLVNNSQQATYTFGSAPAASMLHGLIGSANVALTVDDFSIRSLLL